MYLATHVLLGRKAAVKVLLPEHSQRADLIDRFFERTGVPLLLNTSFNGGGEPIYGQAKQGLDLFRSGRLDALCIGRDLHLS